VFSDEEIIPVLVRFKWSQVCAMYLQDIFAHHFGKQNSGERRLWQSHVILKLYCHNKQYCIMAIQIFCLIGLHFSFFMAE